MTEGNARLDRAAEMCRGLELDCLVLTSYDAVTYFGGINIVSQLLVPDRISVLLLRPEGLPTLVVCDIEERQARNQSLIADLRVYTEFTQSPIAVAGESLRETLGPNARVGVDLGHMTASYRDELQIAVPQARFVDVSESLALLVAVKDDAAIDGLTRAATATREAIHHASRSVSVGSIETDFTSAVYESIARSGGVPSFAFFACGKNGTLAHPEGGQRPMAEGETWRIDTGARFAGGYQSDLARCGVVGEPTRDQTERFDVVRRAQEAGIAACRPGLPASGVYAAVKDVYADVGHVLAMSHVGHGIGVKPHERPMFSARSSDVLRAGMVVNVEPALFLADMGESYHVEDLVLITDAGPVLLTEPQCELMMIGLT